MGQSATRLASLASIAACSGSLSLVLIALASRQPVRAPLRASSHSTEVTPMGVGATGTAARAGPDRATAITRQCRPMSIAGARERPSLPHVLDGPPGPCATPLLLESARRIVVDRDRWPLPRPLRPRLLLDDVQGQDLGPARQEC